jgi:hypothetical protein
VRAGEARRRRAAAEGGQGARPRAEALLRPLPFGCSRLWGGGAHRSTQLIRFEFFWSALLFWFQCVVPCNMVSCVDCVVSCRDVWRSDLL